jgi:hypothetical protein|tara:strand:- start:669 stop:989 length:321 start_codon:yes stop_codon:yes gene_type:complete
MSIQPTKQQKPPALKFLAIISIATAVILVLTITPWNIIPTSITEDVKVIATTELGCVGESVLGHSVVVENCSAKVGDTISATFYVPALEQNGYYDKIHEKLEKVTP